MNQIPYSTYLDKVYGCFLGKTVIGTLGAPYFINSRPAQFLKHLDKMLAMYE